MKKSGALATAALCAIAFAGCAAMHRSAAAATRDGYFPCSLLTPGEVSAALGVPVQHVYHVPPNRCEYRGRGPLETLFVEASQTGASTQFQGEKIADTLMGVAPEPAAANVGIDMRAAAVKTRIIGPRLASLALSRIH